MTPCAIVFDMDGTLLDTERFYKAAFLRTAGRLGFAVPPELEDSIVGLASPDRVAILQRHWGAGFAPDDFLRLYRAERRAILPDQVPLCAGAHAALRQAVSSGVPLAIATSASRATSYEHLARAGLADLFSYVVTRDDVARGKPAPDVYQRAARLLRVSPESCLAVEDSAPGVAAAHAAGLICVRVADSRCPVADVTVRDLFGLARWLRDRALPPGLSSVPRAAMAPGAPP